MILIEPLKHGVEFSSEHLVRRCQAVHDLLAPVKIFPFPPPVPVCRRAVEDSSEIRNLVCDLDDLCPDGQPRRMFDL